ncbi:MAG: alcohol dehydrogenase catalytic domain-containing protein [Lachnospiraceae bacterium]|nr:alcohol dehydrogenase catalytic domain-containing protein [Lachnospiraceae bacterium]
MKALMYVGTGQMEVQEIPKPEGDFLVKVLGCTVCGTDLKTFLHGHPFFKPPTILGHEFYGRVEKAPAESGYRPGDYVVVAPYGECGHCEKCEAGLPQLCDNKDYVETGAFCEYVTVPLSFVPRGVIKLEGPDYVYALTEPLACVLTAIEQLEITEKNSVLVIGGGPMGTLAAMTLLEKGIKVRVAEINPIRQEKLRGWGIPCDTSEVCYAEDKYDRIIVAVNVAPLIEEAVTKVKAGGRVHVFAGLPSDTKLSIRAYDMHYRFVQLMGCSGFALPAFHRAYEMIRKNPARYQALITHRFPLEEGQKAMETLSRGEAFKIMIEP